MRITVIGNCQTNQVAKCIAQFAPDIEVNRLLGTKVENLAQHARVSDYLFVQPNLRKRIMDLPAALQKKVLTFPRIIFPAFHPDTIMGPVKRSPISGPWSSAATSGPVLFGWANKMSVEQTAGLFTESNFEKLGFFAKWEASERSILDEAKSTDVSLNEMLATWAKSGCFMWLANHPKGYVLADLAESLLKNIGMKPSRPKRLPDLLANAGHWAIYPAVAKHLNIPESPFITAKTPNSAQRELTLEEFISGSFELFEKNGTDVSAFKQIDTDAYRSLLRTHTATTNYPSETNPYAGVADFQLWRRAVERVAPGDVDPVVVAPFLLTKEMKVATAGSCFAQHIASRLSASGFNYYVAELAPADVPASESRSRNYGIFSARYGNIYTARQLLQLFDRAYGRFLPHDQAWIRSDGALADPFRPQIESGGFPTRANLFSDIEHHLACVREMFESTDVFVFTLGLTEAWRSKRDGAVFPLAPGVAAGAMNETEFEFVNFRASEVATDLGAFIHRLRNVNGAAKIILTVSPVPLIATYESQHVLVSTTYSKSVLRVAADETARSFDDVWYFPSYEIITGAYNRGRYFGPDLRNVTSEGVDHVMRVFLNHATGGGVAPDEIREMFEIVCDEEAIDAL